MSPCRCLLSEISEKQLSENIKEYLDSLSEDIKADNKTYRQRLEACKRCDKLSDGMCLKCGCYVEMRAAVRNKHCPSEKQYW